MPEVDTPTRLVTFANATPCFFTSPLQFRLEHHLHPCTDCRRLILQWIHFHFYQIEL